MIQHKLNIPFIVLLLIASGTQNLHSQSRRPLADAFAVWNFHDEKEDVGRFATVATDSVLFEKMQDAEYKNSITEGGDGYCMRLGGLNWLSFTESEPLFGKKEGTVLIRFLPQKSGGLLHTERLSIVIHESGLLIVVVAIKDNKGTQYREIPFRFVSFNQWHNLAVRYRSDSIGIVLDANVEAQTALGGELETIPTGSAFIGKWQIEKIPLPGFPVKVVNQLFRKSFTGKIDHIAVWRRSLSNKEIERHSGVKSIKPDSSLSATQQCINAYRDFFMASRKMDIGATEKLGLQMRRYMAGDRKRPVYHLTGPMDAILDPAGAFYYNGKYHVYSYRNMVSLLATTPLAHYVSDDLIHWKDYPIGVWADSDVDVYGIWLGNIFKDDKGVPNMLYTALGSKGKTGVLAQSHDSLLSFANKKSVINNLVHHDGYTWKESDGWYAITTRQYWGERAGDSGDAILLLRSPDLQTWTNLGEIFNTKKTANPVGDQQKQGFTEYPYLLPFGNKWVLMTGTRPSKYWVGRFDKSIPAFIPDQQEGKLLDHLNTFHCFNPLTIDEKGPGGSTRRIIQAMHLYASGKFDSIPWYGVHTIPRVLSFDGERLLQEPVAEVEKLRRNHKQINNISLSSNQPYSNPGISGDAIEMIVEFEPGNSNRFGVMIHTDKNGENGIRIFYEPGTGKIGVDGNIKRPIIYPELGLTNAYQQANKKLSIRIFIDHSLFEVFVNGETFTGVYNGDPENTGIHFFSEGGNAILSRLDFWEMNAAWLLK